jgi:uncharacterized membrane protein YgcG
MGYLLLLVAVLAGGLHAAPVRAQTQSLTWERLDVDVAVQPDGSALVTETSVVNFTDGQFGRGFRVFDPDPDIAITDVRASDDAGVALRIERTGSESDGLRLTYFFAAPVERQRRTFTLAYRVRGLVQVATRDNIVLNWSAVFADRSGVAIKASRVIVRLPGDAIVREATAYGVEARRSGADEATVTFEATEPIPSGASLTVDLIFASDVLLPRLAPTPALAATVAPIEPEPSPDTEAPLDAGEAEVGVLVPPTRTPGFPAAIKRFRETQSQPGLLSDVAAQEWLVGFLLLGMIVVSTVLRKIGIIDDSSAESDDDDDAGAYLRRRRERRSRSSSSSSSSSSPRESSSGSSSDSGHSRGKGSGGGGFG